MTPPLLKEPVSKGVLSFSIGYQALNESLKWLRMELRYGKNPSYKDVQTSEIGNPQPSP